jgi:hypothetical protein
MAATILRINARAGVVPKGAALALDPGHQTRLGSWDHSEFHRIAHYEIRSTMRRFASELPSM